MFELLKVIIKFEEGWRSLPYYCSEGYPTVGYGFKIGKKGAPLPDFSLSRKVGEVWLDTELDMVVKQASDYYEDLPLSDVRLATLGSMAYQMGINRLMKFEKTNRYIRKGLYNKASVEMLDSKWAKRDTPARARRHAEMFASDKLLEVYK